MNIAEETPGVFRVEVAGLSIREIKDIFEDKWGALMWQNGSAYPIGDVKLQLKDAIPGSSADRIAELERQNAELQRELSKFRDEKQVMDIYLGIKALSHVDKTFMKKWIADRVALAQARTSEKGEANQ